MAYVLKRCRGQKPPTMIPTDCYALRAPTILPNIRISWYLSNLCNKNKNQIRVPHLILIISFQVSFCMDTLLCIFNAAS